MHARWLAKPYTCMLHPSTILCGVLLCVVWGMSHQTCVLTSCQALIFFPYPTQQCEQGLWERSLCC